MLFWWALSLTDSLIWTSVATLEDCIASSSFYPMGLYFNAYDVFDL